MCYYGENVLEFSEGLNVVIGDNGSGKSKLFDAIYWVMYDQCFDTSDEKFKTTNQLNDEIISDRALHLADDGQIECKVSLTFFDDRNDDTYTIERKLLATKNDSKITFGTKSTERITERKGVLSAQFLEDEERIKRLKKRILPDNIKPYMWFQGEQINELIDFKNTETLTRAINVLSDITRFDEISSIIGGLVNTVENELIKKQRAQSKDEVESDRLEEKIKQKKSELTNYKDDLKRAKLGLKDVTETSKELLSKLDVAEKIRELDSERKEIQTNLNRTIFELDNLRKSLHKKLFTRSWILKGTENLFKQYSAKFSKYEDSRLNLRAKIQAEKNIQKKLQTRLPLNVPEPIHVQKMLDGERCLVCDRPAKKGTAPYKSIKSLISSSDEALKRLKEDEENRSNFSSTFEKLYRNGLQQSGKISDIDEDINETLSKIDQLFTEKSQLRNKLEEIDNQVKNFVADSSIDVDTAMKITNQLQTNQSLTSRYSTDIGTYSIKIEDLNREIASLQKQCENLVIGDLPERLSKKVEICNHLNEIARSTKKRVYHQLIEQLEQEANKHYQNMIQENKSTRGIIKLIEYDGNYTPTLEDSNGNTLTLINRGNIFLIKLATMMAIISAKKSTRGTDLYTLVSDAPMSVFGEDYTIGFCKTVSQVYNQSIIMSYDFYKNESLRQQLLSSEEIKRGNIYVIEPNIPESERESRIKLETEITILN